MILGPGADAEMTDLVIWFISAVGPVGSGGQSAVSG